MTNQVRTNLYVDGFNLYYGAAKHTHLKWVNVIALAEAVFPDLTIHRTRYFTAMVKGDQPQTQRQLTYIRALKTLPKISIHLGYYQAHKVWARHCTPPPDMVQIHKTEEKGSDVNLATYMMADAFRDDCDQLVVITNDSDLAEPVRIINRELRKRVLVINPQSADTAARKSARCGKTVAAHPSAKLRQVAYRFKDISSHGNDCHMSLSQFPHTLRDRNGTITIPASWV
jgi:uncharacterized LabA/DUF88 family protein